MKPEPTEPTVTPGVFIPSTVRQTGVTSPRAITTHTPIISVVLGLCLLVFGGYNTVLPRVTSGGQSAAVQQIVITQDSPYQARALTTGPQEALQDRDFYVHAMAAMTEANASLLAIDLTPNAPTLSYLVDGQVVLEVPILATATGDSWRVVPAGAYAVAGKSERQYLALQEAYYPHTVTFSHNYLIHGIPEHSDGTKIRQGTEAGIMIANSDAVALYSLVAPETPVLVHVPTEAKDITPFAIVGPAIDASAYVVGDVATGEVLLQYGAPDAALPIASLTKLMTALVVVENLNLDSEVIITQEQYVTTLIPRLEGTLRTTVFNLLQLLLIESSNEAAEVLATQLGRDVFIAKMNETARVLGMDTARFTDPSGLDNGNVAAPIDLLVLTQYLYKHHQFLFAVTTKDSPVLTTRPPEFTALQNFNLVPGITDLIGGKIGETQAAGKTSVTVHSVALRSGETRPVAIILLGSTARNTDVSFIYQYFTERFR